MTPNVHIHMTGAEHEQLVEDILEVFGKSPAYHTAVQWELDQRFPGDPENHMSREHYEEVRCICSLLVMDRILRSISS